MFLAATLSTLATTMTDGRKTRWGILGTGTIASDFARILSHSSDSEIAAVGSRSLASAETFCERCDLADAARHGSYDALLADDSLDIVYIATPSARHVEDSLACLEAGRAVLCEKSMAATAEEAERVLAVAAEKRLFFLHGVWSRHFPAMAALRDVLASGVIGDVRSATCSFGQDDGAGSCSALAETGIYCAQFLLWVFGPDAPPIVRGVSCDLNEGSGLDQHVAVLLEFPGGRTATFECSLCSASPRTATICGTKGVIRVAYPFWCPTSFTVQTMTGPASQQWGEEVTHTFPLPEVPGPFNFVNSEGLAYEAAEASRCVREGLLEAPAFDSAECLRVMRLISDIRSWLPAPQESTSE